MSEYPGFTTLLDLGDLEVIQADDDRTVYVSQRGESIAVGADQLDVFIATLQQARANVVANAVANVAPTFTPPQREF